MNLVHTKKTSIKTINFAFLLVFLLYTYVLGNIKFTTFIDSGGGYQMKCEDVFKETYNREPLQAFCPYRVCPLGAHIDHQDGMIHGMALNYGVHIAYGIKHYNLDITYTSLRNLLIFLPDIKLHSNKIATEALKEQRSKNSKDNYKNHTGFFKPGV